MEMIDEISLKILKILQEKARIPNVEVARQVGMAPSAVLERIRKLEKQGFIDGYEVRLNPERFKRGLVAFIMVKTSMADGHDTPGKQLAEIEAVQEVHYISGADGLLVKVRVSSTAGLGQLVEKVIARMPGVKDVQTMIVMKTFKETARIPLDASHCF